MQEGDATYQQGGYTSYAEDGSTVENASINGGQVGAVYLGYNANDVAYSENNFTNWNNLHGGDYGSRNEAYLAWQSNPNYHVGKAIGIEHLEQWDLHSVKLKWIWQTA